MKLTVGGGSGLSKPLETGLYDAKVIDPVYPVIKQYKNDKPKSCVIFVFELNEERVAEDGTPMGNNHRAFSKALNLTLGSKGHLKPFIEGMLGKKLGNGDEVTLEELVGLKVKLMVTKTEKLSGDGHYAKIVSCSPGDVDFETDPTYERVDPSQWSDTPSNEPF